MLKPWMSARSALALWTAIAALGLAADAPPPAAPAPVPAKPLPAVLCVVADGNMAYTCLPALLRKEHGLSLTGAGREKLVDWEKLKQFNAVMLFDFGRLDPDAGDALTWDKIGPKGFDRMSETLLRYVREGGGLYLYSSSFTHCGDKQSSETMNRFLKQLDAEALFADLHDPEREKIQPDGAKLTYALADRIAAHPATAGVKDYWYPVGIFGYGILGRALVLGPNWQALIESSEKMVVNPVGAREGWYPDPKLGTPLKLKAARAAIYAGRALGHGRVILDSGIPTISFFGYGASEFADQHWGRVSMERGLDGKPSQGLELLASSLRWLTEPSVKAGNFGGFVQPPRPPPDKAKPMTWKPSLPTDFPKYPYRKGVLAALPAVGGGGTGTVAEYAQAAVAKELEFLVCAAEFEKIERPAWDSLVADCKAASTPKLAVVPALITRDPSGNYFLQTGYKSWPVAEEMDKKQPKRISDHLRYWFESGPPLRMPFNFNQGTYPTWLFSAYDTFAVRTYDGGKVTDDQFPGFLQNQDHGDQSRIAVCSLLRSPAELAQVNEFTYLWANDPAKVATVLTDHQWADPNFISTGPRVRCWISVGAARALYGDPYVPGTERWRLMLSAESAVPLKRVTFYDHGQVVRRLALSGTSCTVAWDGLHDVRHTITAVVEDEQGGRAITNTFQNTDYNFRQYFCGDRCNIMGGWSALRNAEGYTEGQPASSQLYKRGRLHFSATVPNAGLPGVDGSGSTIECAMYPDFKLTVEGEGGEARQPVHQILRPYENADLIVFDTPIRKRNTDPDHESFGHGPYIPLAEPNVGARLVQYHFYRNPILMSPVLADLSMTITRPEGATLKKGWMDFSALYTASWSQKVRSYVIVRADGTRETGPAADEKSGTDWKGTLHPGDGVVYPEIGEAVFLVEGDGLGVAINILPSKKWFRMWTGRFDTGPVSAGFEFKNRVLALKVGDGMSTNQVIAGALRFRDGFGLTGKTPGYAVTAEQGKVLDSKYILNLDAKDFGFTGAIAKADLPQRLPVKVNGLNGKWTVAKVDLERSQWFPLGTWNGTAYTTVDTREGDHRLYIGNVLTTDNPDLILTLLPANADGTTVADVHNPTEQSVTATVRVPVTSFLAKAQAQTVTVPPLASVTLVLDK